MALQKALTTRLRLLKETLTATETLIDLETGFYIIPLKRQKFSSIGVPL